MTNDGPSIYSDQIPELKRENETLREENRALRMRLSLARGVPAEDLVAELTDGKRTRYKDRHDVTTGSGHRLEVKWSHLNHPGSAKTLRWNWDRLFGLNETKRYDFLVLVGQKDPRYDPQYPDELPYVMFLVPRKHVDSIKSNGNCVALNTNLNTARASKAAILKQYLVSSPERFAEFRAKATSATVELRRPSGADSASL